MDLDSIQSTVLVEGLDDYVGLWELAKQVRRAEPDVTSDEVRQGVLAGLEPLLTSGYVQAGQLTEEGGFDPWPLAPAEALRRIDAEWRQLDGDPNIWEICWFRNTERGDRIAEQSGK